MKQFTKILFCICLLSCQTVQLAASHVVDIHQFPKVVVLEETGDVLNLRGVALHKHFFQNSYLGAFYSLNSLHNANEALVDRGPKRMVLYFLRPVGDLKDAWRLAMIENNSPLSMEREQLSINQFLKMIDFPLHEGDTLVLDYLPNVGTKVIVKGIVRGMIKGDKFFNLVLSIWMGRQPPSIKFRKDLFNLS